MGWESDGDVDEVELTWSCHRCGRTYDLDHYRDIEWHVEDHEDNPVTLNQRLSRDEMLMEMANVVARRGTCSRLQVGAVFSMDGRIVATGYNGAPAGLPHCQHTEGDGGCDYAEHSERNAIAFAARKGLALEGTELHVTHMPCLACARSVINAGVTRVVYAIPYRLQDGVELLRQVGIEVVAAPN